MTLPINVTSSIDKIALALYPDRTRVELREHTEELIQRFCAQRDIPRNLFCSKKTGYGFSFMLPLSENLDYRNPLLNDGKPKMFVQMCSSEARAQRIRVEISGYPLKRGDYYIAFNWLRQLTGNDLCCLEFDNIKVTRLDIALDLDKQIDELYFNVIRLGKVMMFVSQDGKVESITNGPDNRYFKCCIYDLLAKALTKGKNGERRKIRNGDSETRVELRINPNMKLSKLMTDFDFSKYFKRIEMMDKKILDVTDMPQIVKNHFLAYGLTPTLNALPPEQRQKLKADIKKLKYNIVDMNLLADALSIELRKVKGLDPTIDYTKFKHNGRKTVAKYDMLFSNLYRKSRDNPDTFICS